MNALELDRVSREFTSPDGRVYRALEDITLSVPAGAFAAIVGPSGCGKSTLLNVVAGLLPATSGSVRVAGRPLEGLNRHATYMFQQDALLPWKTVRDNVALGLASFASHYPAQLSGGMRKRVAMAQNWILDRGIVLMDEPFSALDVHTRQRMETELLALWEGRASDARNEAERKTIVFVTHDLEEAIALADYVIILSAGPAARVVAQHQVALERPRDLLELRTQPSFVDLYRGIWAVLREEVIKSQRGAA